MSVRERERETDRQTDTQIDKQTDRDRERYTERYRERKTETVRDRERQESERGKLPSICNNIAYNKLAVSIRKTTIKKEVTLIKEVGKINKAPMSVRSCGVEVDG